MNDGTFYVINILDGNSYIELNLDDFVAFDIATADIDSSNNFLHKLWENFNNKFSPEGMSHCPWAYFPEKYLFKKVSFTYFGSIRTSVGYIHAGVSYKKRGTIEKLYLFSADMNLNTDGIFSILKKLVKDAIENNDTMKNYYIHCEISSQFTKDNVLIESYKGKNFIIDISNERNKLIFQISALNHTDAMNLALKKVDFILEFLSIETNVLFEYSELEFCGEFTKQMNTKLKSLFQNNYIWNNEIDKNLFIDFYPIVNEKLLLSKEAIKMIDKILTGEPQSDDLFYVFLKSCYHFRNSLRNELYIQNETLIVNDLYVLTKEKIENNIKPIIDGTVTGYLSSIETVTSNISISNIEKCISCGQLKYSITNRIKTFIDRYLQEGYGDIFKKIYHLRSLYLHTGESCASKYIPPVRPLLDKETGTGAVDYNGISVSLNGRSFSFSIVNIREWVSYSLRNYYKQELSIV